MSKVAVVYWSSTGNTEAMADAVVNGAKEKGADVTLYECADFRPELVGEYDAVAFGCPAMGDEELEEDEFEPMFDDCKDALKDKKIALFVFIRTEHFLRKIKRIVAPLVKRKKWIVFQILQSNLLLFCQRMTAPQVNVFLTVKKLMKFQIVFLKDLPQYFPVKIIQI